MKDVRCPQCGYRLKTNQCPICLTRVPFPGVDWKVTVEAEKPKKQFRLPIDMEKMKKAAKNRKKPVSMAVVGVVLAVFSMLSSALESCDGFDSYTPDYDYDAYVAAGVGEAADVPEIDPQYIYDQNGLTIAVDGLGLYYGSYTIPVTVTNKTDQNVLIHSNELSVNNFMQPGINLYCEVEAGEEAQSFLILNDYDLKETGITEIGEVAFWLDIYEDEDYTNIGTSDLITLRTAAADSIEQSVDSSGMEVYAGEDVRLVIKSVELSDYGDCCVTIFAENRSDRIVSLMDEGVSLNGEETYGLLWTTMRPHTQVVDRIYISEVQELGIESVEQLETLMIRMDICYEENLTKPRQILKTVSETVQIDLTKVTEGSYAD